MSTIIVAPKTAPINVLVNHISNSKSYTLKLKINLKFTNQSTAKLTDQQNQVYQIGQESILWKGFETIPAKKIPKKIQKSTSRLRIELSGEAGTFKITISLGSFSNPHLSNQRSILDVKTVDEYFELYQQSRWMTNLCQFIEALTDAYQPSIQTQLAPVLTEIWQKLQRLEDRFTWQHALHSQHASYIKLNPDFLKKLIEQQIKILESNKKLEVEAIICIFSSINTLLHLAISSEVEKLPEKDFERIYQLLQKYKKTNLSLGAEEYWIPDYTVAFLAKQAIHKLLIIGNDKNFKNIAIYRRYYLLEGFFKNDISKNDLWALIKLFTTSTDENNSTSLKIDRQLKAFFILNFLQKGYSADQAQDLNDFVSFVDQLLHSIQQEENASVLSVHRDSSFVLGLIDLLHALHKVYGHKDQEIALKAVQLLELIRQNNQADELHLENNPILFRLQPYQRISKERTHVINRIDSLLKEVKDRQHKDEAIEVKCSHESRLLLSIFQQQFPWIAPLKALRQTLLNDQQLCHDATSMLPLRAIDPELGKVPMVEIVGRELENTQKVILIVGELGSGKTLFIKSFIKKLLDHLQFGQPLPFYASLHSIVEPECNLMREVLYQYGLQDHVELLKSLPTLWLLDGYDEIFLDNERVLFNIYQSNQLDKWPLAQFVFTCRQKILLAGEENRYFAPQGKVVKLLQIAPFEESDIGLFLKNYIAQNSSSSQNWTVEICKKIIENLGLSNVLTTPFYIKQALDYLSQFDASVMANIDDKRLLDFAVSHQIIQAAEKVDDLITPKTYCQLLLEISRLMLICNKTKVSIKREAQHSGLESQQEGRNSKPEEVNMSTLVHNFEEELQRLLFSEQYGFLKAGPFFKSNEKGEMEFSNIILYQYFANRNNNQEAKQRLLMLCDPAE